MLDVVTLGESMLRLSPARGLSLEQATELEVFVGGAESNVAVTLSRLGVWTGWISRLVDDPLGRRIAAAIRGQGVDTSALIWTAAGRTGLYFLEPGVAPRNGRVIYDRRDSAAAGLRPEDVNWAYLRASRLLHLTCPRPGSWRTPCSPSWRRTPTAGSDSPCSRKGCRL